MKDATHFIHQVGDREKQHCEPLWNSDVKIMGYLDSSLFTIRLSKKFKTICIFKIKFKEVKN